MGTNGSNYLLDGEMREGFKIEEYKPERLSPPYFATVNKYTDLGRTVLVALDRYELTRDKNYLRLIVHTLTKEI